MTTYYIVSITYREDYDGPSKSESASVNTLGDAMRWAMHQPSVRIIDSVNIERMVF